MALPFVPKNPAAFQELLSNFPPHLRPYAWTFFDLALMRCQRISKEGGLSRGQFYYGREEIEKVTGITPQTLRTIENRLEVLQEFTRKSTNKGSVGTLLNIDTYIIDGNEINKPATNQQQTSNNSLKEKEKEKKERLRATLEASPHWEFISRISGWFFALPHTVNPSPHELLKAQREVELVLRLDMKDAPDSEQRLEQILQWAVEDDPRGDWPGWKTVTLSLSELRKKRGGVMKWQKIEAGMKTALNHHPPTNGKPPVRQVVDEIMAKTEKLEREQAALLVRRRQEAGI